MLEAANMQISMSRTGNPYDNAHIESFFKTLKYEEVHLGNYETFDDVTQRIPHFIEEGITANDCIPLWGTYLRRNPKWRFN
jgi:transposase InsO family protein